MTHELVEQSAGLFIDMRRAHVGGLDQRQRTPGIRSTRESLSPPIDQLRPVSPVDAPARHGLALDHPDQEHARRQAQDACGRDPGLTGQRGANLLGLDRRQRLSGPDRRPGRDVLR